MKVLGETQDDAVGEAFDKTAKLLGLPYPGGPELDKLAQQGKPIFEFPTSKMPGLTFSFSGIKTAVLYFLQKQQKENSNFIEANKADICASIQQALVQSLMQKLKRASRETGIKEIAIAGGVAANSGLRQALAQEAERQQWNIYLPPLAYCTDNAAMVGIAGWFKWQAGEISGQAIAPNARLPFPEVGKIMY